MSATSTEIRYFRPTELQIWMPESSGYLRVEVADDRCILNAQLRRLFPMSKPDEFISIQDADGKEVGVLRNLDGLPTELRDLLVAELDRRYFTPKISQILNLKQEGGMWTFNVLTSRGEATFFVRNWRDSSYEVTPGRFMIQSVDGQRFEIPSYEKLDTKSQLFIEQLF
jgi:hypothetical protein